MKNPIKSFISWLRADNVQSEMGYGIFLAIWRPILVGIIAFIILMIIIKSYFKFY